MPDDESSPWKVGVLFSRSGVTGLTETEHFLGTALAIEEINAAGGVRGRSIEPLCLDPAGDPSAYRTLARRMMADEGVGVIFGCSLSASRKAVLPLVERHDGLLWYPSIYEGFEHSESVLYSGATLNQTVFPLADHLLRRHGPRILLVGSDYIYPRESNRVMRDVVESRGGVVVGERYVPLDADDDALGALVAEVVRLEPDAVFSTVVGRGARRLYRLYAEAGIDRARRPIASLTLAEGEIAAIGPHHCDGHLLAATYFGSLDTPANRRFASAFRARFGDAHPPSMWSETAYAQVHLFARALAEAGTLDARRLGEAALRTGFAAPEGDLAFDAENRHLWLTPGIGAARPDGQFDVLWRARAPRSLAGVDPLRGVLGPGVGRRGGRPVSAGARRILDDLRRARVLVVHPRDEDGTALLDHLRRLGCGVEAAWPPPTVLPSGVDTVFALLDDGASDGLLPALEAAAPAVIAIVTYESPTALKSIVDVNAHGVIAKPLRLAGVLTQFALARYRHGYEGRLGAKIRKLEDTMKGRRVVEKATKVLMGLNGLDEEAAYRLIRDRATAKRMTMAAVAESLVAAHEAMSGLGLHISLAAKDE